MRQDRPFLKEASNASDRPGAQHSSQAIERPESTLSGHSRSGQWTSQLGGEQIFDFSFWLARLSRALSVSLLKITC